MPKVIYESYPAPQKRYVVEFFNMGRWVVDSDSYHFKFSAKYKVKIWNSIGNAARVVDTKDSK